jgi:NAD+ synthase (glutamine-hydrolysing)
LYQIIELRRDPENLLQDWTDGTIDAVFAAKDGRTAKEIFTTPERFVTEIERTWKLYKNSFFKRVQAPPIIAVSKRAFGYDLRESQNGVHFTRRYEVLKEQILSGGASQDWQTSSASPADCLLHPWAEPRHS